MARFAIYSDLHFEFGSRFVPPASLRGQIDGIILAGDISAFPTAFRHAREISDALEAPAVLIAGNHEFYGYVIEQVLDELRAQSDDQVRFLECGMTEVAGTRILGTVLWTDFKLNPELEAKAMADMASVLSDFREIRRTLRDDSVCRIDTDYLLDAHNKCRTWLSGELKKKFNGPTLVATHTAPSRQSIKSHGTHHMVAAAFASDMEQFIQDHEIAAWVHGHIHDSVDYMIGQTRVVSNPYGYERFERNSKFDPEFVIEI